MVDRLCRVHRRLRRCAVVLRRRTVPGRPADAVEPAATTEPSPSARRRVRWVVLAFIPSSLLLGVTTHVQTDIAAVPLLWAIPLSLYLLTFVIAFSPRRPVGPVTLAWILPFLVVLTVLTFLRVLALPVWATIGIHELTFFVAALLAHERLADDRPDPVYLTEFYLLLAVGGVLGGLFNALIAPILFDQVLEYPMLLVAVLFLRPRFPKARPAGGTAREALGPGRRRGRGPPARRRAGLPPPRRGERRRTVGGRRASS